jgi:hypothetical protein
MMRARLAAVAAGAGAALCVAALAFVPAAGAQSGGSGSFFVGDVGTPTSFVFMEATVSGSVSVDFHGDAAAGCAAAGMCGVSGTVTWRPGASAELFAFGFRRDGRPYTQGLLALGQGERGGEPGSTAAQVRRAASESAGPGLCSDAAAGSVALDLSERRGSSLPVRIAQEDGGGAYGRDSFRTRCAGPAGSDVAALLPTRVLSTRALRRGHRRLDFSADRPFAARGLAGTVHSDVVITIVRTERGDTSGSGSEEMGPVTARHRLLDLRYRVKRVSGSVTTSVAGLTDPDACAALDSCGTGGSVTLAPSAHAGRADVQAFGPARHRTPADLRRALGLLPGRRPSHVQVSGYVAWEGDRGSVTSALTRGGAPDCRDSAPLGTSGYLSLDARGNRLQAAYGYSGEGLGDPLRTRCPGPGIADVAASHALATGSLPLSALRHRRVTLHLTRGARFRGDGYRGRTSADLTVVLRRTSVRERIEVERGPDGRVSASAGR